MYHFEACQLPPEYVSHRSVDLLPISINQFHNSNDILIEQHCLKHNKSNYISLLIGGNFNFTNYSYMAVSRSILSISFSLNYILHIHIIRVLTMNSFDSAAISNERVLILRIAFPRKYMTCILL